MISTTINIIISKVKKLSHYHHAGVKGERRHSSFSILASALDGVNGQHQAPAAL
jgi:hypothetical protein